MNEYKIKDYKLKDTIAAVATSASKSALGVIKISGKDALRVISRIFAPRRKKNIRKAKTYTLHYGWIVDSPLAGERKKGKKVKAEVIDEVLVSVMRGPATYTREDVVEISCHGGAVVLDKILKVVLKYGARLALPGEFTYRALVKGRIDLLQTESILGIIEAKTEQSLSIASSQLTGQSSKRIFTLKEQLKELFAQSEALINFPEEDLNVQTLEMKKKIKGVSKEIDSLIKGSNQAKIVREGVKCVICGKTNAGKSTIFNRLLKEERVIVSKMAGTTRDVIEETINIKGIPLRIYDTAGILEPQDLVTKKALEKTSQAFEEADLVILVFDGSRPLSKDDYFLMDKSKGKNAVFIINKTDLSQKINLKDLAKSRRKTIRMSAFKDTGLKKLEAAVYSSVYQADIDKENIIFLNQYQRSLLESLKEEVGKTQAFLKDGYSFDFVKLALKGCLDSQPRLTGEVFSEEVLENIFSRFCIGK